MEIYLVGGAVRDQLLGRVVHERDWVVVGATPEQLLAQGYRPVGKSFPVFLHPKTQEEYALARTEKKTGPGYTGFDCYAAPDVTLEDDLLRRDLTINAMAQGADGQIVDPFNGQADLEQRLFRHVSEAFVEDPVRLLRLARFAARYVDFSVALETLALLKQMVAEGEVDALVPERVWQEQQRALGEAEPLRFFEVLEDCGAASVLLPGIQPECLAALQRATLLTDDPLIRFAALMARFPVDTIESLSERYRWPKDYRDLALLVAREWAGCETLDSPEAAMQLFDRLDLWRRPQRLPLFLQACQAQMACESWPLSAVLQRAYEAAAKLRADTLVAQGLKGRAVAEALAELRLEALKKAWG